jgi:hypothetical protein
MDCSPGSSLPIRPPPMGLSQSSARYGWRLRRSRQSRGHQSGKTPEFGIAGSLHHVCAFVPSLNWGTCMKPALAAAPISRGSPASAVVAFLGRTRAGFVVSPVQVEKIALRSCSALNQRYKARPNKRSGRPFPGPREGKKPGLHGKERRRPGLTRVILVPG